MKLKVIGPENGRITLFEKTKEFLGNTKELHGVEVITGNRPDGEEIFFALVLWDEKQFRGL